MTQTIAATGATRSQGGAVARLMLEARWKMRAITRSPDSDAAEALRSQGADVVFASFDDEESLIKAFEGAQAIFAVTQFWAHVSPGRTQEQAGEQEARQGQTLAHAAAKTTNLEHYIWSTHPSATKASNGKWQVPHLDYKAAVDDYIREELPGFTEKTTFLFLGWCPKNMAFSPSIIPFEVPGSNRRHLWIQPSRVDAKLYSAGDVHVTPGIWVRSVLSQPQKAEGGRYCAVVPEILSWVECLRIWSEVTSKKAMYANCSLEEYADLWGVRGREIGLQWKWREEIENWNDLGKLAADQFVTVEQLGIKPDGIGMKAAFEKLRDEGRLK